MKYQKENVIKTLLKSYRKKKKKKRNHLGISLTKEVNDLNAGNDETITEKFEADSKRWKDSPRSLTGKS